MLLQADMTLARQAADLRSAEIEIQHVRNPQPAMELFRSVCVHDPGSEQSMAADALEDDAILIMPPNYELLHHDQAHTLSDLVQVRPELAVRVCGCSLG